VGGHIGKTLMRVGKILANEAVPTMLSGNLSASSITREGGFMSRRSITDKSGRFSLQVEVHGSVLEDAIDHSNAEEVLKCAFLMALSVLAQDGPWPGAALESMSSFMTDMKSRLVAQFN
jgi:hypothetical protein